jgi:hypothetical protein
MNEFHGLCDKGINDDWRILEEQQQMIKHYFNVSIGPRIVGI